ncbi:MAG: TolC family protein [Chitinophagales bacterium]
MIRLIITFIFILTLTNSYSQKLWTLEECVTYAKENNIQIKKAQLSQQLSEYSVLQSKMNFFPGITANTGYYFNFGKTIDPTTNLFVTQNTKTNTLSINGNLGLFNGFQRWNALKQSQFDLLASQANTQNVENNIELYVVGGFLNIVYAKENLGVAQDQLQLAQDQLDRTQKLVESGALAQSSLYDIEAQEAQSEVTKVTAQNSLDIAKLNLSQLLNLTEPLDISIPEINMAVQLQELNQSVNDIYDSALVTQPSIHLAEYQEKSAEKGLDISRGRLYPSLSLFGSLTTNYSNLYYNYTSDNSQWLAIPIGFVQGSLDTVFTLEHPITSSQVKLGQQYHDNFGKAFGFSLDIPIFNNWQNRTNVNRSKVQVLDAQYNLESAKQQLLKDVQSAYADAVAAKNSYEAALKAVSSLQKAFDDSQLKFNAGAITSLDFTTAKNNYNKALSDLLQSKYQYIFKLKVLDFYQGKPLTLQ